MSVFSTAVGQSIALATHLMIQVIEVDEGRPIRLEQYEVHSGVSRIFGNYECRLIRFRRVAFRVDGEPGTAVDGSFQVALRKDVREEKWGHWEPGFLSDDGELSGLLTKHPSGVGKLGAKWIDYSHDSVRSPVTLLEVVGEQPTLSWVGNTIIGTGAGDRVNNQLRLQSWQRIR